MSTMSTPGWESVKENAAPLQRGRNVSALERAAAVGRGGGSGVLQAKKDDSEERIAEFEQLVRPSEAPHVTELLEDDPLMHWMAYIKYYQENLPSDTHQQFLLMERCTRALVKMPQYSNDDRFISVCAKYADKTKEPGQVFKYLHQQKVGSQTALFWVAWAYVAEKDNDYPFAEQIYKKGVSKDAQPMNILKVRHKQFQRRMSRHWLNSSQMNDQLDEYEEDEQESTSHSRGALGGLSHDRVRRNDRSRAAPSLTQRGPRVPSHRTAGSRGSRNNTNTNNLGAANDGFSIFVENEGENAPNSFLDQPMVENKRVIERDSDRRKENTLNAEKWNERGALNTTANQSSSAGFLSRPGHARSTSRGAPPPPFAVFVDEECAVQHEKEVTEHHSQAERHRSARDERTFRDRSDEGLAERLSRDPLRYVRDHSKFEADVAAGKEQEEPSQNQQETDQVKASNEKKRGLVGFNKRLLKDPRGVEQSFEEARATSKCYTLAPPSVNCNFMMKVSSKTDQSSEMDLDDGESMEVSMAGSSSPSQESPSSEQPIKMQRLNAKPEGRVLFRPDPSFENSLNQTAVSTASSAVNEADAVGVPTRREEETINTKLAMRELSMMFSSPAFGVDDDARRAERRASRGEGERGQDISFANVGDGLGHSMLDNSILNVDDSDNENSGPRNPHARSTNTPGFDNLALRELRATTDSDGTLGCNSAPSRVATHQPQRNPLQGAEAALDENPGFQVYEEEDISSVPVAPTAFGIYEDNQNEEEMAPATSTHSGAQGFKIFEESEEDKKPSVGSGFAIYEETEDHNRNDDTESETSGLYAQGDTATFSVLGDTVGIGENELPLSSPRRTSSVGQSEQGDTATLSLFNEIFPDSSQINDRSAVHTTSESPKAPGGFSIFVDDDEDENDFNDRGVSSYRQEKNARKSTDSNDGNAIDYSSTYGHGLKMALRRLQASSSVASNSRSPLLALLTVQGKSFHLPHIPIPREFRSKHLSGNTKVQIGKHSGVVNCELGRGAYGVVALMDVHEDAGVGADTIAVKAQSPTDCLAWECEILRRLEDRTKVNKSGAYVFPRPLSFISLADGGILSMTSGSKTGLNLVDLANVYKLKLGEHVPEIITLHYVSRMLRHLEQLHWHGKILHCDIKPDNFVLSTLSCQDNSFHDIDFSDLMLVDFGRAVDLEDHAGDSVEARSVMFRGDACQDDMKCVAMRGGKSWSYDIDTFGVLACAHVLLYGTHIKIRKGKGGDRWTLANSFKRYWQKDIWTNVFGTLLNLDEESGAAIGSRSRSLRSLREAIDAYTDRESDRLRSFLSRQLTLLPSSRDQLE